MAKDPAYPMYAQDFDMDTADWGVDEVGIYIRLLNYQWINGHLPDDLNRIAKIARVGSKKLKKSWRQIETKFSKKSEGNLQNRRMEEVREKRNKYIESQRKSGKKGAKKRWGNHSKPNGEPIGNPNSKPNGENIALQSSLSLSLDLSNDKSETNQPDIDFDKDKKRKKTPPAAHTDLSKKDLKKTSKHFSENVGNLFESILKSCKTISKLPGQKTKRPFNPYQFVQKHVNEKRHPGVIDETLKAVSKYWGGIRGDIYTYANAIVKTKNKNWNEKEAIAIHNEFKKMDVPMLNELTRGLFKLL